MKSITRIPVFILFCLVMAFGHDANGASLKIASFSFTQIVTVAAQIDLVTVLPWYADCSAPPDSPASCPPYFFPFGVVLSNASFPVTAPPSAGFTSAVGLLTNGLNNGLGAVVSFLSGGTDVEIRSHGFDEDMAFFGQRFNDIDLRGWTIDRIQVSQIKALFTHPTPGSTTVNLTYTMEYFGTPPFSLYLPITISN